MGGLETLPQEHDTIVHSELVAHVMRTGQAAPWQSFPGDLLTGHPTGFYPNGFHLYAAIVGALGADPVAALNGAMVVLFAVALPVGTAALGLRLRPGNVAPLTGGAAALIAAVAYRPLVALMHDGGILANAASFSIAPGVIVLALLAARLGRPGILPLGLAIAGSVVVHPTSVATIGLTAGIWLLATTLPTREGRRRLGGELAVLAMSAGAALVALIPFLLAASGVTTSTAVSTTGVASFSHDVAAQNLHNALRITFTAPYGGFYDPHFLLRQNWIFVLSIAGIALCLILRANAALVAVFAAWAAVVLVFLMNVHLAPLSTIAGLYYNSYPRVTGGLALAQWLASGFAVAVGVDLSVRLVGRTPIGRWRAVLAPALGALAVLALVVIVCVPYGRVNAHVTATRFRAPEFVRVDKDDLAAAEFVAKRIGSGERVMNSPNDGSGYGYVFFGLPIVVDTSLGSSNAPYTTVLLQKFNELDSAKEVRDDVCRLRIAWAIVDDNAPAIGANGRSWVPGGIFTLAPGLQNLGSVPHVSLAARFGHVSVFSVDRAALGCPAASAK
jgi:hypothetical protein